MRVVLVTGTRDLDDPALVWRELDKLQPDMVIHGAARGVDAAAAEWAAKHGRYVVAEPAQWRDERGNVDRSAGAKRNTVMVEFALRYKAVGHEVVCLAMPGPRSVGTHDCGRKAAKAGLRVVAATQGRAAGFPVGVSGVRSEGNGASDRYRVGQGILQYPDRITGELLYRPA